jgi:diacylglycerol kinase (ATP)
VTDAEGFSLRARIRSFGHAWAGVVALVREEHNARVHGVATCVVAAAGLFFGVSRLEWCALVLATSLVWGAEAMNTAIEHLADAAVPERNALVGKSKDAAAGATLLCAICAAVVGAIVFVPHVAALIGQ